MIRLPQLERHSLPSRRIHNRHILVVVQSVQLLRRRLDIMHVLRILEIGQTECRERAADFDIYVAPYIPIHGYLPVNALIMLDNAPPDALMIWDAC